MKKTYLLIISLLTLMLVLGGCSSSTSPDTSKHTKVELNISAAISMKDALTEIQNNYKAKNPNVNLVYNFGSSGSLQKQIEQGAPADIFISAAPKQMNALKSKDLIINDSHKNLIENTLVVIVPKDSTLSINSFQDLSKSEISKLAIGEINTVPAGQYAAEVLKTLNIFDNLKDKIVYTKDVRSVLAYVETGNVDAGIVYKTDAAVSTKTKLVALAPAKSHQPIVYPIAILKASKEQKSAEGFINYLFSDESKAVFEKYGFTMCK